MPLAAILPDALVLLICDTNTHESRASKGSGEHVTVRAPTAEKKIIIIIKKRGLIEKERD